MPHIASALWEGPAFVLVLAAVLIALAWFLWGDPDRSDRLSVWFGSSMSPGIPVVLCVAFAAIAVTEALGHDWERAGIHTLIALFWLLSWRRKRRDAYERL